MERELKVGDSVKIRKDSGYYDQAPDKLGVVESNRGGWYKVRFEDYVNSYRREHLHILSTTDSLLEFKKSVMETIEVENETI